MIRRVRTSNRNHNDQGAAMVEFALVATMLLVIVFGIIAFGRAYNAKTELTGAVREGARAAALRLPPATVVQKVIDAAPGLGLTAASVTAGTCAAGDVTSNVTVTATYTLTNFVIPGIASGDKTFTSTGVMRCGG
jgi:Flp pilus assembly protein TadG